MKYLKEKLKIKKPTKNKDKLKIKKKNVRY